MVNNIVHSVINYISNIGQGTHESRPVQGENDAVHTATQMAKGIMTKDKHAIDKDFETQVHVTPGIIQTTMRALSRTSDHVKQSIPEFVKIPFRALKNAFSEAKQNTQHTAPISQAELRRELTEKEGQTPIDLYADAQERVDSCFVILELDNKCTYSKEEITRAADEICKDEGMPLELQKSIIDVRDTLLKCLHLPQQIRNDLSTLGLDSEKPHSRAEIETAAEKKLISYNPDQYLDKPESERMEDQEQYKQIQTARNNLLSLMNTYKHKKL